MKADLMPVAVEVNNIATAGLSEEEFAQLGALLQKVRENLSAVEA
jgi:hypothetical protein